MEIKKAAVIGSGVMGAAIAAHLANAGVPCVLLDVALPDLNKLLTQKPAPLFHPEVLKLISVGFLEKDIGKIKDCDWIVEVVTEKIDIKKNVFDLIEKNMKIGAILSSNTSGIRLKELTENRSKSFCKNFIITHFFNPVRYMKLVEIVADAQTDPAVVIFMTEFLKDRLGKGVVLAKDTPSFVANRIGVFGFMNSVHHTLKMGFSVEAVDKITGPAITRPKTATLRMGDMAGLDTVVHVAKNNALQTDDEGKDSLKVPDVLEKMIQNKWVGDKTGQGFYKKTKTADGQTEILSLNLKTLEYQPQEKIRYDSLGAVKSMEDPGERLKTMTSADDDAGKFAWLVVRDILTYTANRIPEIADDIVNIDNAMKWGYNWELGPFEMLDVLGVKDFAQRLEKDGIAIPAILKLVLKEESPKFYKHEKGKTFYFDIHSKKYIEKKLPTTNLVLKTLKETGRELKANDGASVIDLGDGVVCVEFHTKMNAIDGDVAQMVHAAIDLVESNKSYRGVVISNDAANFSVGANLMLLWMESQAQNWAGIENLVKGFQALCMRLRYSAKPVVCAPFGMALGGGCEITLGCDAVRAYSETYIGLVEVGAGLIPGGGGNKNLIMNIEANRLKSGPEGWAGKSDGGPFPKIQQAFETIGFAKVATSAVEAMKLGYLPSQARTQIQMSRDKLIFQAKQDVLELSKNYQQPQPRSDVLVPGVGGKMALYSAIEGFQLQKKISDHDALIAKKLAHVLCGGDLPTQALVSEQYLLDIEREAFLSLCGEQKTLDRMQHLLMKGKPLRN